MFSPQAVVRILLGSISSGHQPERYFTVHITTVGNRHTCLLRARSDGIADALAKRANLTATHAAISLAGAPPELGLPHRFNAHFALHLEGTWVQDVCWFFFELLQPLGMPHLEYAEQPPQGWADSNWTLTPLRLVGGILRLECPRYFTGKRRIVAA